MTQEEADKLSNSDWLKEYRVFPRLFAVFYLYWTGETINWAMDQPELSTAQAGFVAAVITGAAAYFKFYVETGVAVNKKG